MRTNDERVPWHSDLVHEVAEERDLVRRLRAGDEAAFETFSNHYITGLYRFAASRLGVDRELAREVVAATICKAIEKLESFRGDAPLFTWLCAVCRNEIAGHYRRQQGRPTVDLEHADDVRIETGSPEDVLLETESSELVHRALDHLPPRYAAVLQWKYLDGLPVDRIAEHLSLGVKAAESVLTRARHAFRETYEQLAGKRHHERAR